MTNSPLQFFSLDNSTCWLSLPPNFGGQVYIDQLWTIFQLCRLTDPGQRPGLLKHGEEERATYMLCSTHLYHSTGMNTMPEFTVPALDYCAHCTGTVLFITGAAGTSDKGDK